MSTVDDGPLEGYYVPAGCRDELIDADGTPLPHAVHLLAALARPAGGEPVWVGADPTNRGIAGENHVKIGHGRHYPDVPPIKGVYRGTASSSLDASVTMTRLDGVDPASIARA